MMVTLLVLIVFTRFKFQISTSQIALTSSLMIRLQFTQPQSTALSGLGAMLES